MFTGLIECIGTVSAVSRTGSSIQLTIKPDLADFDVPFGGSVAVDGACLTVEKYHGSELVFSAVKETVDRTTLNNIAVGRKVNLERALKLGDRLDGHLVQGHIDGVGMIISDTDVGGSILRTISVPDELDQFMAFKGSVTVDGISLTIANVESSRITISLIPVTIKNTTMSFKTIGDKVNLECDVLARYIQRMLFVNKTGALSGSDDRSLLDIMERSGF